MLTKETHMLSQNIYYFQCVVCWAVLHIGWPYLTRVYVTFNLVFMHHTVFVSCFVTACSHFLFWQNCICSVPHLSKASCTNPSKLFNCRMSPIVTPSVLHYQKLFYRKQHSAYAICGWITFVCCPLSVKRISFWHTPVKQTFKLLSCKSLSVLPLKRKFDTKLRQWSFPLF